ncbi:hypothetical protein A2U01_0074337, partial [Trifolium medium]|nr:hypothetical protein [Trifolium medium]
MHEFRLTLVQVHALVCVMSREDMVEDVKLVSEWKSLKVSSSKSSVRTECHTGFHRFERMLVVAACLVGRKE